MVSTVKVDVVAPRVATGTTTLGVSGDKLLIPSGVTITNSGTASGFASGLSSVQAFTASSTWTKPTGITKVTIEVQGGGGGGHTGSGTAIMGGSGGGYAKKILDVSSISTSTITIGAGGGSGVSGGDSIWADGTNTITGYKGIHGTGPTSTVGGLGNGGDVNIQGGGGGKSYEGRGGASVLGNAGNNYTITSGQSDATGYGGGGGGCETFASGAGTAGIVIVWEYK